MKKTIKQTQKTGTPSIKNTISYEMKQHIDPKIILQQLSIQITFTT